MQTPLEIIKEAYDKVGINYLIREEDRYFYLVFYNGSEETKKEMEAMNEHEFIRRGFMEFTPDGQIASY